MKINCPECGCHIYVVTPTQTPSHATREPPVDIQRSSYTSTRPAPSPPPPPLCRYSGFSWTDEHCSYCSSTLEKPWPWSRVKGCHNPNCDNYYEHDDYDSRRRYGDYIPREYREKER